TLKEGGVCTIINQSCCVYVNQESRIENDLEEIWKQSKTLHSVAQDDTSWGFQELWKKLTSWLPDFGWLKHLFILLITLVLLGVIVCVLLRCFMYCCQHSAGEYATWKRNRIRHQIETGKYFAKS
ncbi:ERVV2 protein, partial [Alcedo cyanopectus]|nr:ERVV2 protein [Ceyx cyanopectus]